MAVRKTGWTLEGSSESECGPSISEADMCFTCSRKPIYVCSFLSRLCHPVSHSSKKRIYSSPLSVHFHSDESLTNKGFYFIFRAFSPEGGESITSLIQCGLRLARLRPVCL